MNSSTTVEQTTASAPPARRAASPAPQVPHPRAAVDAASVATTYAPSATATATPAAAPRLIRALAARMRPRPVTAERLEELARPNAVTPDIHLENVRAQARLMASWR